MPDTLHLVVGDNFTVQDGVTPVGWDEDYQAQMEYLTAELGMDPAVETEGGDHKWFLLADVLQAMLLRIEALEE